MKKTAIITFISAIAAAALIISTILWITYGPQAPKEPIQTVPEEGYYKDPPSIVLTCGGSELKPSTWCLGWETPTNNGIEFFHASYPHPLSEYAHHKTLSLEENTVHFDLTASPESVSVVRWPKSEIGKSEDGAKSEPIPHEMTAPDQGTLTAEVGYLYCISGYWKGGTSSYYFIAE